MRHLLSIAFVCFAAVAAAQEPLYIVNGEVRSEVRSIPPADIEHIEVFPAEEATIARFGPEAGNGAIVLTLRYDRPAHFLGPDSLSFAEYVAREVGWKENDPTARVVVRYSVDEQGAAAISEELEATDKRLLRRVRKAFETAPAWAPATKEGAPVRSEGVLRLQLPAGRPMPRERYVVIR